jgi:hypothetical protein
MRALSRAGGYRHGAIDAVAALLQALEHHGAGAEVDPVGGERQDFGQAAAAVGQGHAQRVDVAVSSAGHGQEGVPLRGCQVFAGTLWRIELHPRGLRCRAGVSGLGSRLGRTSRRQLRR